MNDEFPRHSESFEVVLLKRDVSSTAAEEKDFKRIPVDAENPLAAMMHEEVAKEVEYRPLFATKPGIATDPEIQARRRAMEGPAFDRSKV